MVWRNQVLANHNEAEKDEYLIAHLAVNEQFRRQGIGQALLAKGVEEARRKGYSKLVLEVEIGNEKAIALYRKSGFEITNTVRYEELAQKFKSPGFYKMTSPI